MPIQNCVTAPTQPIANVVGLAGDDGTGCGTTIWLGPAGYYVRVNAAGDGLEWVKSHEPAHLESLAEPFQWDDALQCGVIPLPGTLVDNGDGSFTFTPGDGSAPTTIRLIITNNDAPFSWDPATWTLNIPQQDTLVENGDGTFTFNPGNGGPAITFLEGWTEVTVAGSTLTFHYPDGSTVPVDVCALIAANCADTLTDNGDGSFTFTPGDGSAPTTIRLLITNNDAPFSWDPATWTLNIPQPSTLTDNGNGTITFNPGNGAAPVTFREGWTEVSVAGSTLTFTYPDGSTLPVNICSLVAANCPDEMVNNGDGTYTHTAINGVVRTIDVRRTTVVNNGDGTYTLTDDFGNTLTIAGSGDVLTTLTNVINGHRIGTYTNEAGIAVDIDETITTVTNVVNGHRIATYTNENGATVDIDETVTTLSAAVGNGHLIGIYVNELGEQVDLHETISRMVANNDGTITYTDELGNQTFLPGGWTTVDVLGSTLTFTYPDGNTVTVDICVLLNNCSLDALGDVTAPAPGSGQVLTWNGSAWVPATPASGSTSSMVQGANTGADTQTVIHDDGNGNTYQFVEGFDTIDQLDQCIVAPNPDRYLMERVLFAGRTFHEIRVPDHYSISIQPELGDRLFFQDPNAPGFGPPFVNLTWVDNDLVVLDQLNSAVVLANPSSCRNFIVDIDVWTRLRLDTYYPLVQDDVLWIFSVDVQINGGAWESIFSNGWGAGVGNGGRFINDWGMTTRPLCQFLGVGQTLTINHRLTLFLGDLGAPDPANIGIYTVIYNRPTFRLSGRTT